MKGNLMKTKSNTEVAGQVILIFVLAGVLYFGLGMYDWPIVEVLRD